MYLSIVHRFLFIVLHLSGLVSFYVGHLTLIDEFPSDLPLTCMSCRVGILMGATVLS